MLPDKNIHCPATGFVRTCFDVVTQCTCPKYVHIRGKDPQTGQDLDSYGCVDGFMPALLLENAKASRQAGAAIESFRNEVVQAEKDKQAMLDRLTGGPPGLRALK